MNNSESDSPVQASFRPVSAAGSLLMRRSAQLPKKRPIAGSNQNTELSSASGANSPNKRLITAWTARGRYAANSASCESVI